MDGANCLTVSREFFSLSLSLCLLICSPLELFGAIDFIAFFWRGKNI